MAWQYVSEHNKPRGLSCAKNTAAATLKKQKFYGLKNQN